MAGPDTNVTHRAPQQTGRLVTVLSQSVVDWIKQRASGPRPLEFTDLSDFDGPGSDQLRQVLQRYGARTIPSVRSLSTTEIIALDRAAQDGPFRPEHSLLAYWIIDPGPTGGEANLASLAALLSRMTDVFESVHREEAVGEPPINWQNDQYAGQQFHLDPAPAGIDAKYAWDHGVTGAGIGFADVEMGWNLSHEDLKAKMPQQLLCHQNDPTWADHGTGVLGLIVGINNAKGIIGIAPRVTSVLLASHWDGSSAQYVADAIATAAQNLNAGDVLLLETQTAGRRPIELMAGGAEMTAIQVATSKGIVVIEAAGNGGRDLDPYFPATRPDSGAIVVGASVGEYPPASMNAQSHERLGVSNYGDRVNCFAPGICLVTAGGGDLDAGNGNANCTYSASFRDTSGASAVVAGVAILAQHMQVTVNNSRLKAGAMRDLLTQHGMGQSAQDGNIGIMPDLRKIAGFFQL